MTVIINIQGSFQVIVATDGETSYAIFSYSDVNKVRQIVSEGNGIIGFDAGDERRSDMVVLSDSDFSLKSINVFRIDGKVIKHCDII